jgi:Arc/MetJ-type ribon-helix-helix transcriptional regulator
MGQQHIQTRVPDDLADRIDTYQEHEEYMNDAEALRALLRAGLDAEGYADDPTDGTDDSDESDTGGSIVDTIRTTTVALAAVLAYSAVLFGLAAGVAFFVAPAAFTAALAASLATLTGSVGCVGVHLTAPWLAGRTNITATTGETA